MKKYLLTALLGVFSLFTAFVNADTIDGFISDTDICKEYSSNGNYDYSCNSMINNFNDFYMCVSSDSPYYFSSSLGGGIYVDINTDNYCFSQAFSWDDDMIAIYNNEDDYQNVPGTFYFSLSPITYSSSSGGGSSSSSSSTILSGGISQLSPVISSISSVMSEFIPYVVYIGIGILLVTLGFKAIKRLVNWLSSKITRYFK